MKFKDLPLIEEVKTEYVTCRENGMNRKSAVAALCQSYENELTTGAKDDGLLFWIGLADAQYASKELSDDVAQKGLQSLDNIENSHINISRRDISVRRKNYTKAPMPERTIVRRTRYRCKWCIGDTFAHLICGAEARQLGIEGKYALIRKVDDFRFGDGRILPVVTVSIWDGIPFPKDSQEFQRSPFLRMESGRLGAPEGKYEYRAELLIKNEEQLSAMQLQYVGNFPDVPMPDDEVIFTFPGEKMIMLPDMLNDDCCLFWKMDRYYSKKRKYS